MLTTVLLYAVYNSDCSGKPLFNCLNTVGISWKSTDKKGFHEAQLHCMRVDDKTMSDVLLLKWCGPLKITSAAGNESIPTVGNSTNIEGILRTIFTCTIRPTHFCL